MSLHSYPSIFNMGHRAVADLLKGPVYVQEKVDGSQFSFGLVNGEIVCRSKGCVLNIEAPDKMFKAAVDTVRELAPLLTEGYTYRGEYLAKPKHNALAYERIPLKHIILFDINVSQEGYLPYTSVELEAARLGLEVVPLIHVGPVESLELFRTFLQRTSVLGGQKIEGVVVKPLNYDQFGQDKKCLMGKFVSEEFKEVHAGAWKEANPSTGDVIALLGVQYGTQARWQKALLHLKEAGKITDAPQDIGLLFKEVNADVLKECQDEIKQKLFDYAWNHISRSLTRGLPEWYKDQLLKRQFEQPDKDCVSLEDGSCVAEKECMHSEPVNSWAGESQGDSL